MPEIPELTADLVVDIQKEIKGIGATTKKNVNEMNQKY